MVLVIFQIITEWKQVKIQEHIKKNAKYIIEEVPENLLFKPQMENDENQFDLCSCQKDILMA